MADPFDFGATPDATNPHRQPPSKPVSIGLVVARLVCALVGFFAGLLGSEILIVDWYLKGNLAAYNNNLALLGGLVGGLLGGALPGLFWRRS